ncbi:MAG: phenylacetic acid degradation operon negative regulatory protein PaaX [Candidatus Eremiobacteraeota bacterium]|nr:phenylacetic acid degradation operon negative regulatory protein PaaX [Candidatus Eremiobacteraeota bacterium]
MSTLAGRPVARPNSFIFTLYGDMVARLSSDGSLRISALIRLMATFGVSAAAVRQAVSRMTRQGWLVARREGNRAAYGVTDRGSQRIVELSPRIYGPVIGWDGRWRLLSYAIGEAHRKRRERLRKELSALGWAPLSPSTWISPSDTLGAARDAARATGTLDAVNLFTSEYRGPLSDRQLLERCWDVDAIAAAYREFVARYAPLLAQERARPGFSDEEAFVQRLWLVHDYRRFVYLDPGLPSELLPAQWPGTAAAALFRELYAALEVQSQRYFHLCAQQ